MKKITYSLAIAATLLATSNTFAQQGFGTNTPHRSAAVEIQSTNKGLLIPRVELDNDTDQIGLVPNAHSLLVFNTKTVEAVEADEATTESPATGAMKPGYYYWDKPTPTSAGKWVAFSTVGGSNALGAENALTLNATTNKVELGGTLYRNTDITLNGNNFTIATGNNDFNITSLTAIPDNVQASFLLQEPNSGKVYNGAPNMILDRFLKGKNGIKIEENDEAKLEVKLGGTIDEDTNFNIVQGGSIAVQGLKRMDDTAVTAETLDSSVNALGGGHLIPVGTTMNGELKVATATEIVDAGIVSVSTTLPTQNTTNILTTKINNQADQTATVDLNNLVLTGDVTGTLNTTTVTKIQGVNVNQTAPQTDASQGEVLGIGTDGTWTRMSAGDIVSTGVNANNGLTKDGNLIQLGGDLTKNTTIDTKGFNLAINSLQNSSTGNKRVVIERVTEVVDNNTVTRDVLRTVERSFTSTSTTLTLPDGTTAENFEEIIYKISLGAVNQEIKLPDPSSSNEGQIINVVIESSSEIATLYITGVGSHLTGLEDLGYTGVVENQTTVMPTNILAYGEMLGQRFTLKSDGTNWIVTSRM